MASRFGGKNPKNLWKMKEVENLAPIKEKRHQTAHL